MPIPKANFNHRKVVNGKETGDHNRIFINIPKEKWDRIFKKEDTDECQGNTVRDQDKAE